MEAYQHPSRPGTVVLSIAQSPLMRAILSESEFGPELHYDEDMHWFTMQADTYHRLRGHLPRLSSLGPREGRKRPRPPHPPAVFTRSVTTQTECGRSCTGAETQTDAPDTPVEPSLLAESAAEPPRAQPLPPPPPDSVCVAAEDPPPVPTCPPMAPSESADNHTLQSGFSNFREICLRRAAVRNMLLDCA
jgi:hypothetical protein